MTLEIHTFLIHIIELTDRLRQSHDLRNTHIPNTYYRADRSS